MKLTATITDAGPFIVGKREYQNIGRDAIETAGKLWHYKIKRRHFQMEAFDLYQYKNRGAAYETRKARIHPEAEGRPLVYTGETERLAMASNKVDAKATDWEHYHADVIVNAPQLNRVQGLYDEMVRTSPDEDAAFEAIFAQVFDNGVTNAWKSHGLSSAKIELGRQQLSAA